MKQKAETRSPSAVCHAFLSGRGERVETARHKNARYNIALEHADLDRYLNDDVDFNRMSFELCEYDGRKMNERIKKNFLECHTSYTFCTESH